jgi:putative hemolysin
MDKVIDLEKVLRTSDSKFIRTLPGFIIRLLEKIVCQYEINETIWVNRMKDGVPFINDVLDYWNVKFIVRGEENIPPSGRFVFVSNHPVGAIDALTFFSLIYRHFQNIKSPTNQLLNYIPNLQPVMLGVNVFGLNTKETVKKINELFASDAQIMIFPAGTVSRRTAGVISDIEWQKTFITKAIQNNREVIPVHISGRNSNLFYFTASLRKFLRMKTGFEILLLPREMISQRGTTFTLTVGKPISTAELAEKYNNHGGAARIKELVYSLPASTQ